MGDVTTFEAADFTQERVFSLKGANRIVVVFSTLGEREAELVGQKISLLRRETGRLIDQIVLSHRRLARGAELTEKRAREADPGVEVVVTNGLRVPDMGDEPGKGADMRRCLYHLLTKKNAGPGNTVVVFLDADVKAEYFGAHFVRGLAGAVLEGKDFAKASFYRAMGRVKKYLSQPLNSVIIHKKLEGLASLSYPLSGEAAGTLEFFSSVFFWQRYGVETGINIDACAGGWRIADVNLGLYDHEHHDDIAIQKMAFGILRVHLLELIERGMLRLSDGASISDVLRLSYIDEHGSRRCIESPLDERRYRPLKELLL